jgi:hypothetical protein
MITLPQEDTRIALKAVIKASGLSQRKWAKEHGIPAIDVSECLSEKGRSVSPERENPIRDILGLEHVVTVYMRVGPDEHVVKKPGHGRHRRRTKRHVYRSFRCTEEEAILLDAAIKACEYKSFSDMFRAEFVELALFLGDENNGPASMITGSVGQLLQAFYDAYERVEN